MDILLKKPLSSNEMINFMNGKAKVITYPNLHKYKTIEEVLNPYGVVFLLYNFKPKYGHWVALFKYPNSNIIEHYDAYNYKVDEELNFVDKGFRNKNNMRFPHLTKLLYDSPYEVQYNNYKHQKHSKNIATCGRHTLFRVIFKDLNIDEYNNLIKKLMRIMKMTADEVVTFFTQDI